MINRNGYEVISEEDYYKEIMNEIKKQYPNMTEHPSNILVILARVLAKNENKRDYDRMESYSSAYIATATEKSLSKAVKIAGVSRYSGTSAVGKIIITKAPEVEQLIIPKEMVVKSGINKYKTINSGAIIMNDETLELEIVSSEIGMKYNISKESKFQTILNVMGIKNIVAKTNIEGGTDMESDAALRARYYARMNSTMNSSLKGVLDYVESVPDVILVSGIENSSDSIKDGMAPHSISIFAEGATDYDVAKAIMNSKPAGIQTNGNITVNVNISGRDYPVKFSRYEDVFVYVNAELVIDRTLAPADIEIDVKAMIEEYVKSNNKIVSYEFSNEISQEFEYIKGVKSLYFGLNPNPSSNSDIVSTEGKSFNIRFEDIRLVVV